VVGAGVIGIEYASMINVLPGTNVTIIDPRSQLLGFVDREVVDALQYSMRHYGARFIMGENVGESLPSSFPSLPSSLYFFLPLCTSFPDPPSFPLSLLPSFFQKKSRPFQTVPLSILPQANELLLKVCCTPWVGKGYVRALSPPLPPPPSLPPSLFLLPFNIGKVFVSN